MSEIRPDPDELLVRAHEEERRRKRGKLTIFFGAAPGVGKTYAMLEAAHADRKDGRDVVVGVIETHGRSETASLLSGLEVLPRQEHSYHGVVLGEFALDAALRRRPGVILVDELAHTNAEGARHLKRWQDVSELLDAGINVYTTMNVQHLESLKDVVAQVTGVVVRESVPDSLFERADELRLVDLPPDELLERLRDGKVYVAAQATLATDNFFRKGNLIALRELALRRTAERVDAQMQVYRRDHGIEQPWTTTERILVCVSPSPQSARLVRAASRMTTRLQAPWIAVFVETPQMSSLSTPDRKRVSENLNLAEQLGAESATIYGDDAVSRLVEYARKRNVSKIVLGKPTYPRWRNWLRPGFLDELVRASGDVDIYVIAGEGDVRAAPAVRKAPRISPQGAIAALAVVTISTLLSGVVFRRTELADIVMVYLLGIVIVATRYGHGPSLLAAVLSVLSFDFFFIPPYLSIVVSDLRHVVTFAVMLIVAALISELTQRVRRQADAARAREGRTASLYSLSRDLAGARSIDQIAPVVSAQIKDAFDCNTAILLPSPSGPLKVVEGGSFFPDEKERGTAEWVWLRDRPAGIGTDTLPSARALYVPLDAAHGQVGVIGLEPTDARRFRDPEQRHRLDTFAQQIALAVDRALLAKQAQGARVQMEAEQLRNALLSSVSHDLRTPLGVVKGAGSALVEGNDTLTPSERHDYAQSIVDEADRLNRHVRNLLDMTRLEAGVLRVRKEWHSLEEILGTAISRLDDRLRKRVIAIRLSPEYPLVPLDALLVEQVFINLIENASRYTPESSPIEIRSYPSASAAHHIEIEIADRGPGIPPGEEEKLFDKFYRAREGQGGIGLGLTICRGIVSALGRRIWAENRSGGGAVFRFTLPIEGTAPTVAESSVFVTVEPKGAP